MIKMPRHAFWVVVILHHIGSSMGRGAPQNDSNPPHSHYLSQHREQV